MRADAAALATLFTALAGLVAALATLIGVVLAHRRLAAAKIKLDRTAADVATVKKIVNGHSDDGPPSSATGAPSSTGGP